MRTIFSVKRITLILSLVAVVVLITGCANSMNVAACLKGEPFGFWGGLWHGIIAPIDLIVMLWRNDVTVFAQNNNGAWYAFGFILGSGGWGFLGGNRSKR